MRHWNLASLSIAAALALWAAPAAQVGQVTRLIPRAELMRGRSTLPLHEKDAVAENDRIRTEDTGRVRVVLNDGSILTLGSSSLLTVKSLRQSSKAGSAVLAYGRLRAVVTAQSASQQSFQVRTATAVLGVLGTTVYVEADRKSAHVVNISEKGSGSRVRVRNAKRRIRGEVILMPGEGTVVEAGRPPIPPHSMGDKVLEEFVSKTEIPEAPGRKR